MENKKTALLVSANALALTYYEQQMRQFFPDVIVYQASDALDAMAKITNAPPNAMIMDYELPKTTAGELSERILRKPQFEKIMIVLVAVLPKKEQFIDEFVTGRVQFLENPNDDKEFSTVIRKALGLSTGEAKAPDFSIVKISAGKMFLTEGEIADAVYILRAGEMRAFRNIDGKEVALGPILPGEFVGEMAYLNQQPRSASVQAVTDCEAVFIPMGTFERVLLQRPMWSKALLHTLSKRLSVSNEAKLSVT